MKKNQRVLTEGDQIEVLGTFVAKSTSSLRNIIHENLTRDLYLTMLEETIDHFLTVDLETQLDAEGNFVLKNNLLDFEQDSAPFHYSLPVRRWINERLE